MNRYKITLSYDGTPYFGWQKTKSGPSVQELLEKAVSQVTQEPQLPDGASRTDRGVHAEGQVASLCLQKEWDEIRLQKGLNACLPDTIRIHRVERAPLDFHPTLQAKEKEYHYHLCLGPVQSPLHFLYSWHVQRPLDLTRMVSASNYFLGRHDFSAFANADHPNPFCTINRIAISQLPEERLQIALCGDRFLYKMARTIVGTLVYVGCNKLPEEAIEKIFIEKDRTQAGVTAPPHGLSLFHVRYDLL
ncbi:MAG: tRNA pseudouridine(38-40) synthase TruA [Chlamydiia bacterium]|nr:tRNA pseudouridine(38-40) synthase TruA [Chlamydiia bacterium]